MPRFGRSSSAKLKTCHKDIQAICHEAIETYDFTVLFGYRSPKFQFSLFKKGRRQGRYNKRLIWRIVDKSKIVTYKDGFKKKSRHNEKPSTAIDLAPWPINWKNINEFYYLAGHIKSVSERLLYENRVTNILTWGGRWKSFLDYPHFQLKKPIKEFMYA